MNEIYFLFTFKLQQIENLSCKLKLVDGELKMEVDVEIFEQEK
jgi:hypothetical protein